jgi:hypothetical protein
MKPISIYDQEALQRQIRFQTEKAWDLEEDFPRHQDIQMD